MWVLIEAALKEVFDQLTLVPVLVEHFVGWLMFLGEHLGVNELLVTGVEWEIAREHGEYNNTK